MRNRHAVLFNLRSRGSSPARNRSPGTRIRALLAREEESRGTAWKNGRHFISGRGGEGEREISPLQLYLDANDPAELVAAD